MGLRWGLKQNPPTRLRGELPGRMAPKTKLTPADSLCLRQTAGISIKPPSLGVTAPTLAPGGPGAVPAWKSWLSRAAGASW